MVTYHNYIVYSLIEPFCLGSHWVQQRDDHSNTEREPLEKSTWMNAPSGVPPIVAGPSFRVIVLVCSHQTLKLLL